MKRVMAIVLALMCHRVQYPGKSIDVGAGEAREHCRFPNNGR